MEKFLIHKAALESDYESVLELIHKKVDLNELDNNGHTPLHWAVFRGDIELVQILLTAGADPNIFSSDGVTPKWRAKDFYLTEIDRLLEKYGGKVMTNEDFDGVSFAIFNDAIGQPLPEEDADGRPEKSNRERKWWKFW
ncbi:MAG: ankyrin repeat domain-containing protein [Chitinophagaceae bacterium]